MLDLLLPFPPLPWLTLLAAAGVVILAYVVLGMTGFGSSIVAVPLLAHLLPIRYIVPMVLMLDLVTTVMLGMKNRQHVEKGELKRLLPFAMIGIILGATVLVKAPERWLLLLLGVFTLCVTAWTLLTRVKPEPISTRWAAPAGAFGGVFTALYGTGGPVYATYLARRIHDKNKLRATMTTIILLSAVVRLALFTGAGLYAQPGLILTGLLMMPCALLGLVLGSKMHSIMPTARVIQVVWSVLTVGGAALVLRALTMN